ncbi:alpha-hydroxy acid oxidase [Advenella mimigardefordensis]|uniref:FMN-dependent alpha-hydroxy acid dehydrogenase n=1 Tax=Advenella mimigardefordensis (strain DSM 17166 / LMG 22922 / DPN7) TaxID=1247726 RepID=W0PKN8_ADVMD|nr:alpha-hydroxy acid oxidase [Advenella mimigardefordensis]AHG65558.1 FMN-dependent alpha-hydroxy acid dehydrogenase [Advenella mimigardefordensis DPN7]
MTSSINSTLFTLPVPASNANKSDFNTLSELCSAAQANLPKPIWDYLAGGAGTEATLRRNRASLDTIGLRGRVLRDVRHIDTQTTLLGLPLAFPFFPSPIGSLGLIHTAGAAAVAEAATSMGTTQFFGINSEIAIDNVVLHATRPLVLQLYLRGDLAWARSIIDRAVTLGFHALCITVDVPVIARRDRDLINGFVALDQQARPNLQATQSGPDSVVPDWQLIESLVKHSSLPVIIKGIQTLEDARLAESVGAKAVYLSNHGGRQLDYAASGIEMLSEIAPKLNGSIEIYVDGGFQNGSDIVKAIALGARAIGLGKMQGYALAAGGAAGLQQMLRLLHEELATTMALVGATRLDQLGPQVLRPLSNIQNEITTQFAAGV